LKIKSIDWIDFHLDEIKQNLLILWIQIKFFKQTDGTMLLLYEKIDYKISDKELSYFQFFIIMKS